MSEYYKIMCCTLIYSIIIKHLPNLQISTAPARTLGSRPVTDIEAVNDPSILNTTHSVLGGITAR